MREDNICPLLHNLLSTLNLKITRFSILKHVQKHLVHGKDVVQCICGMLNGWGIESRYTPINFDMLKDLPIPSLVFLFNNRIDKTSGQFMILLSQDENGAKFLDIEGNQVYLQNNDIEARWTNIVIGLDAEDARDEKDYESKLILQHERIHKAGGVTVIMPVYNQETFIARALVSLKSQTYEKWELILIDDGSRDHLMEAISPFLQDERIRYLKNDENKGLGYCLNQGLNKASYDMIAYLPADDIYYKNHLQSLVETLVATEVAMVYSGVLHHSNHQFGGNYGSKCAGIIDGYSLQLVQGLHIRTNDRWIERDELVTDDLNRMFFDFFLKHKNKILCTREVTCEWVDHLCQRHKIINDHKGGGIYSYKQYYQVKQPIRFQSTVGNFIDEVKYFKPFRYSQKYNEDGLKILLVGELAYNPERVIALEEQGHKLYGIWLSRPANYNTIGPLPFGNVENIPVENCSEKIATIKPDIIYALLNYQAVPLAYKILKQHPEIPFVWHFKEGPSFCLENGTWPMLINLYRKCDGRMYTNATLKKWFDEILPPNDCLSFVMDGELPKKEWFLNNKSKLLSEVDGENHTVFVGRPIGISPEDVLELAEQKIHLHFYGDIFHVAFKDFLQKAIRLAPDFIHTHKNCTQENWVKEFSQYDAGWLHLFKSRNYGEILRANWYDLNNPARISTYAMAGIPILQRDNTGHIVAAQAIADGFDIGIAFKTFGELGPILKDKHNMDRLRNNVWNNRFHFCFDSHVDDLISFFHRVIQNKNTNKNLKAVDPRPDMMP